MAQTETIQENFFQAIDTIVQNRIANLPYDKTIECEVIEQVINEKNVYKVQYQGVRFEALSMVTNLQKGDIVYVQVPQSDFRKEKFIIASKRNVETQKVKSLPFLSFIKGNNLFSNVLNQTEFNLQLNSHKEVEKQFTFIRFDGEELAYGFTRMGLKATFGAAINTPLVSGDYGIKVRIYGYNQKQWTESGDWLYRTALAQPNNTNFYQDFYLKKEDMIGTNLYNTHGFQNQEKVFDITGWVIDSIVVSLWQDNEFKDVNGTEITNKFVTISNLQLYLGYDINQVNPYGEPTLLLQTKDGWLYNTPTSTDPIITKDIEFKVIKKEENSNNYVEDSNWLIFNTAESDTFPKLEQYDPSSETASKYSKKYYFVPFNPAVWNYDEISDRYIKIKGTTIQINKNNKFLDPVQNGYCYTLGLSGSALEREIQAAETTKEQIEANLAEIKATIQQLQEYYDNTLSLDAKERIQLYLNQQKEVQKQLNAINKILQELNAKIYVSNELWFVHKDSRELLLSLVDNGLESEREDEIVISGSLVFSGPELLFKSSDGVVLLRLNTNNSQFMGNADSATYCTSNNDKYNIYENFAAIQTALRALGSNFQLKKQE